MASRLRGLLDHMFFQDANGDAITVNGNRYRQITQAYLLPDIGGENNTEITFFQQNGATAHTAKETMQMLKAIFPNRLIYLFLGTPDLNLNAPNFFLWRYLKEKVCIEMPDTLQQLKRNIIQEINSISQETLMKVMNSTVEKARQCLTNNGGHLKDIVFHTTKSLLSFLVL